MTMQKIRPITFAASLLLAAGSTAVLCADDPSDDGCTQTRDSCWNEVFCDMISDCLEEADGSLSVFQSCIVNDAVAGHEECVDHICPNSYLAQQARPTNDQCNEFYKARKKYCQFDGPGGTICGQHSNFGGNSGFPNSLKAACRAAARHEWLACLGDASPNVNPGAFSQGVFTGGAAEAGAWNPARGIQSAQVLLVPLSECSSAVDKATVEAMVWTGDEWEWIALGEFERGADMCTEVNVDLRSVPANHFANELDLIISWVSGDVQVWGSAFDLTIAESGIPGDFDRDGERNAADLSAFIDAYDNNAPRADRNDDRVVNAEDLALFLAEYDSE